MINLTIDGLDVQVEEGSSLLDVAQFYGIKIPTLCHHDGLTDYGACRLCIVEIGKGANAKLVSSCTYPAEEGLSVRTNSKRVVESRKMLVELLLAMCPSSKTIQDLAAAMEVRQVRFKVEHNDCILCGLCVRMCAEQMDARAIGFVNRGKDRKITTPFDIKSDVCRTCGGCMYICPACELRCQGPNPPGDVCGACANIEPVCLEDEDDKMCFLETCGWCYKELGRKKSKEKKES
jgi:NADH dehydrogenase/NADH:ubiquinone oxidoreductase subunit G